MHSKLTDQDQRPPVWVGHIVLETDRLAESEEFMSNHVSGQPV